MTLPQHLFPSYDAHHADMIIQEWADGNYINTQYGRLVDMIAGYWNVILGHRNQLLWNTFRNSYFAHLFDGLHPSAIEYSDKLCEHTGYAKVIFGLSGTDAVDNAIRIAWQYTMSQHGDAKNQIVTIKNGFHGTSGITLAASGFEWRRRFLPVGFATPILGRWMTDPNTNAEQELAAQTIDWANVSAFLFEPILGVGGIRPLNPSAYQLVAKQCQQAEGLLIADEVSTGCGRTGTFLATESFDPKPDIVCLGKALTSDVTPLSATLISQKVWQQISHTTADLNNTYLYGHLFAGNPAACRVGLKVLSSVLPDVVVMRGSLLGKQLHSLQADHPQIIEEVRGKGLMWGLQIRDRDTATAIAWSMIKQGVARIGQEGRTLTFFPPYTITPAEIDFVVSKLSAVMQAL